MNARAPQVRGAVLLGLLLVIALALAPAARADEAAPLYETGAIVVIDLTLSNNAKADLEAEPDEYVEGTFELGIDDDGVPGGHVTELTASPLTVGIRLKGTVGSSFRPLTEKAAFKVKFKQFGGPKFLGLKKMTLNNMVEDPSMIHEALTYSVFRGLKLPAPRTGYAFVRVNGEPYGVYLDIEDIDDVALKRIFGSFDEKTQHLYEGEHGADVVPGGTAEYEVDEGDEGDVSDLEALIAAVNGSDPASFAARVAPVADLEEMTLMWAIEKYIGRWDGYAGNKRGVNQPNNYFLYSDPAGVFQMMPWGSDETWEERLSFDSPDGLMFTLCLEDPTCAGRYWTKLKAARGAIAGFSLDQLATDLSELLEPWQEDDPRKEVSMGEIETAVAAAQDFIAERPGEADAWLAAHEPQPETPGTGGQPQGGGGTQPPAEPDRLVRIERVAKHPGKLLLRVGLLAPGQVRETVTVGTQGGRRRVCSPSASSDHAATLTLTCAFPRFARQLRHLRPLRLRVVTEVHAADGGTETTVRRVTLPRD